jgi:hypothetical protein
VVSLTTMTPRIVPRRGSVVHREVVEKLPSGFGAEGDLRSIR